MKHLRKGGLRVQLHLIKGIKENKVKISETAAEFPSGDQVSSKKQKSKQEQNACIIVIMFRQHKKFYEMAISLDTQENHKGHKQCNLFSVSSVSFELIQQEMLSHFPPLAYKYQLRENRVTILGHWMMKCHLRRKHQLQKKLFGSHRIKKHWQNKQSHPLGQGSFSDLCWKSIKCTNIHFNLRLLVSSNFMFYSIYFLKYMTQLQSPFTKQIKSNHTLIAIHQVPSISILACPS